MSSGDVVSVRLTCLLGPEFVTEFDYIRCESRTGLELYNKSLVLISQLQPLQYYKPHFFVLF